MTDAVLDYLNSNRSPILERLYTLLRCPSVSTDPAYAEGMESARVFWQQRLGDAGFTNIQRLEAGGHPAIFGEYLRAPGKLTFLVYGHYDVQPPDPLEHWQSPPFEPTLRGDRIYARGISDDKAPSLIALETLSAFLAVEGELPVNIKVLLEGEEEMGSATLAAICQNNKALLNADAVISADGARWRTDLPTVNIGSRGMVGFEFVLKTADKDLHSGRYGGAVPNALHILAALIATLHDEHGAIAIPELLQHGPTPTPEQRAELDAIPFDETSFYQSLGTIPYGDSTYSTLEKLWLRPSLDLNGMWGGYTGTGSKTVIPNEARAKLTLRLALDQHPQQAKQALIAHLQQHCPDAAELSVVADFGASAAYSVPPTHPLLLAAEESLQVTLGQKPVRVRIGATLPLSQIVLQQLGLDTVMFSFSVADEDFHAPNEFFRMRSFDEGFAAWVQLVRLLSLQSISDYAAFKHHS